MSRLLVLLITLASAMASAAQEPVTLLVMSH